MGLVWINPSVKPCKAWELKRVYFKKSTRMKSLVNQCEVLIIGVLENLLREHLLRIPYSVMKLTIFSKKNGEMTLYV